jgi:hypothetical protein
MEPSEDYGRVGDHRVLSEFFGEEESDESEAEVFARLTDERNPGVRALNSSLRIAHLIGIGALLPSAFGNPSGFRLAEPL